MEVRDPKDAGRMDARPNCRGHSRFDEGCPVARDSGEPEARGGLGQPAWRYGRRVVRLRNAVPNSQRRTNDGNLFRIASLTSCISESRNSWTLQAVLLRASTGLCEEVCPMGSEGRDDSVVEMADALTLRQQVDSDRYAGLLTPAHWSVRARFCR